MVASRVRHLTSVRAASEYTGVSETFFQLEINHAPEVKDRDAPGETRG